VSGIAAQRNSLAMQEILDQSSFVAEYMSRSLRQAQRELGNPGVCLSHPDHSYEETNGGAGVKFLNTQGDCQEFFLETGRIKERLLLTEEFLTSDNLAVTSLQFILRAADPHKVVRVTFAFEIEGIGSKPEARPKLQLQTTVSQRKLEPSIP